MRIIARVGRPRACRLRVSARRSGKKVEVLSGASAGESCDSLVQLRGRGSGNDLPSFILNNWAFFPASFAMLVTLNELQKEDFEFNLEIEPGKLDYLDDQLAQVGVLRTSGVVHYRDSTREILVKGSLAGTISFPCDRCLERVSHPLQIKLELAYLPEDASPSDDELEIGADDVDLAFYQENGIDLFDVLREQMLLDLPMRRVCVPKCVASPLPDSPQKAAVRDPRWSALEGFRPKREEK